MTVAEFLTELTEFSWRGRRQTCLPALTLFGKVAGAGPALVQLASLYDRRCARLPGSFILRRYAEGVLPKMRLKTRLK